MYIWGPLTYFWGKENGRVSAVSNYRGFWDHMEYGHDHAKMVTLMDQWRTYCIWGIWYTSKWSGSYGWKREKGFWEQWSSLVRGRFSSRSWGNGACTVLYQSSLTDSNDISPLAFLHPLFIFLNHNRDLCCYHSRNEVRYLT